MKFNLATAHAAGGLKRALAAYVKPEVLCIDELGYLPIDKFGADCLIQIISHRYERGNTRWRPAALVSTLGWSFHSFCQFALGSTLFGIPPRLHPVAKYALGVLSAVGQHHEAGRTTARRRETAVGSLHLQLLACLAATLAGQACSNTRAWLDLLPLDVVNIIYIVRN